MTKIKDQLNWFSFRNRFEYVRKSILKELFIINNDQSGLINRLFWLFCFGTIVVFAAVVGGQNAENNLPTRELDNRFLNNELFEVETSLKNIHHQTDNLIIKTEWIQYNFTISNNFEKDAIFKVKTTVSNSGKNTWTGEYSEIFISEGHSKNLINSFPMELEGVNVVNTKFEMYNVHESGRYEGKINLGEGVLAENDLQSNLLTLSFSDYNALREKAFFFKVLWVIVAPLAAITLKHLRDIVEDR